MDDAERLIVVRKQTGGDVMKVACANEDDRRLRSRHHRLERQQQIVPGLMAGDDPELWCQSRQIDQPCSATFDPLCKHWLGRDRPVDVQDRQVHLAILRTKTPSP
jgi:hypothetical protein